MPRVIANPGRRDERVHELDPGETLIGRGRESDIRVPNKSLSRQHARLKIEQGRTTITDLGSKNGTFIDGQRVEDEAELFDGQQFSCGDVVFVFSDAEFSVARPETMVREISAEASRALVSDLLGNRGEGRGLRLRTQKLPKTAAGRLEVLLEVGRLLSSPAESIDNQLVKILDLVFSILDIDRAAIIMIDPKTGEFESPVVESRRRESADGQPEIYSKHILNYVRERSVAALFSDAAADPRLEGANSIHLHSVRSSMCAPLKPHDEIIGVLYVDNLTLPAAFDGDDLELLSAFAAQAAIAIENSRLYQRLQEEAVKRNNLLRFFPPTTIAQLMKDPDKLGTEAIDTEVTALFCDISGFTALSAKMDPRDVVELLNQYFPVITEIVFEHEGTLEKYIGDALLAVWGAPFRRLDDAKRALQAAVEMQIAIERLTAQLSDDSPPLRIHIGLNSGRVAAGNIGSQHYLQYATIGDATNIASRVCGLASPGEIALAVPTLELLGGPPPWPIDGPEFHKVKGREEPIAIYKLRWRE